jgi:UDP-N-acetylglucosamine transferase subunit ALG13
MTLSRRHSLFVSVGTDHHPFDRLVRWVDQWLVTDHGRETACLVQSGTSIHPRHADWVPYLSAEEMRRVVTLAAVVVAHAGPGTIIASRSVGLVPILIPRRKALGEAVDDHQVGFAARMAEEGEVVVADSPSALATMLDRATQDASAFRAPRRPSPVHETVRRFAGLVEALVHDRPGDRRPLRLTAEGSRRDG